MSCGEPKVAGNGRWAVVRDLPRLHEYRELYNTERQVQGRPDTHADIEQKRVAVLDHQGQIVSVIRRNGETARYACVGATFTFPEARGSGFAKQLVAFVVNELAAQGRVTHLIVDDDNLAAIRLYQSVGFQQLGRAFIACLGQ